jgi:hypothetical protein
MERLAIHDEDSAVRNWRVSQLMCFGIPGVLAEIYADRIDWHQIARLVRRGCPPRLALRIVL